MKPAKINVFAVPSHVVFQPSGKPIRVRNEGRSLAESQQEWLQHRLRQASRAEPVQSATSPGKPDYDK
jgi:predicted ATPase